MLVRYRCTSIPTMAQLKADIDGIIQGTITAPSQLSAPAQTSVFYGTYPTGKYARVNQTSYTYSKVHNSDSNYTHYFRLTFDSTSLASITLAQGYTSGTDTLLNTKVTTTAITPAIFDSNYPMYIDIVVSTKMLCIMAPNSGSYFGIFDIGHNGVTRAYTSSMMMCAFDFLDARFENIDSYVTQLPVYFTTTGGTVPYSYNLDTLSYGSLTYGLFSLIPLKRMISIGGSLGVVENPIYLSTPSNGNSLNLVYGLYKIPTESFGGAQVYKDANNLYRLTLHDFSFLVD
jgi:hypothetical protein